MNFVTALAYVLCLALPAAFTQPGDHLLAKPCMSPLGLSRSLAPSASLVCQLFRVLDDMSGSGGGSERGTGRAKKNDGAENEKFLPQLHNYTETRNRVSVTEKTSLFLLIRCETGLVFK